ncbi:hypothetical protein L7F22_036191 [Adiantum nelumboides]|nr:hypothetical protein [Adiantum nelumboides]
MGEKGSDGGAGNVVDMSLKCRCRWRWDPAHDRMHSNGGWPFGGSGSPRPLIILLGFCVILGTVGLAFSWLILSPFRSLYLGSFLACQNDNEGSWAVGMYFGSSPFSLRPIEQVQFSSFFFRYRYLWDGISSILSKSMYSREEVCRRSSFTIQF